MSYDMAPCRMTGRFPVGPKYRLEPHFNFGERKFFMKTKIKYLLPIDKNRVKRISKTESITHKIYKHSIDFMVPVGTPVKAAESGIVVDAKDNSSQGGVNRKYEKFENFVEIRHGDEYSYYGHLKKNGVLVKIGDKVKTGQLIGYSGATGWMANIKEPHLHFMVGRYSYNNLKIKFKKPYGDI